MQFELLESNNLNSLKEMINNYMREFNSSVFFDIQYTAVALNDEIYYSALVKVIG